MSFDWSEYLILAEHMMGKIGEFPDQEAVYRSIISRAYYAVFCLIRNYVRDVDHKEFHGNDHQALQKYLMVHAHQPRRRLGNQLQDLHQHRIKADYHDNLDESASGKASRAITMASNIKQGLAQLPR
jgi:hypothetical protein